MPPGGGDFSALSPMIRPPIAFDEFDASGRVVAQSEHGDLEAAVLVAIADLEQGLAEPP